MSEASGVKKPIRSYHDLDVYQESYDASIEVCTKVVPNLPPEEKYDLGDQLRRSSKAVPRLIAEGYAKKHQLRGFQKYLDDANGESNETQVGISQVKDIYFRYINRDLCERLIDTYDKISRKLYNLSLAWDKFQNKKRNA